MVDARIDVLRSIPEVEKIRTKWQEMQWHPNSDIDNFLMTVGSRKEIINPFVIMAAADGHEAIVVGRIENTVSRVKFGYKTLYQFPVRQLSIIHGGLLGTFGERNTQMVISAIFNALREKEAELAFFNHIPVNSTLYIPLKSRTSVLWRSYPVAQDVHWKATLHGNHNDFLKRLSSKSRYNLRRVEKSLEKEFPGDILIRKFDQENDVEFLMKDAEQVAKTSYQRGLRVGFADNPDMRVHLTLMAEKNWLCAYILYLGGVPCAFWMGTKYNNTFFLDSTGYNPSYYRYEIGTILFLKMIEDLYQDKSIQEIDFGLGHASYKERFADNKSEDFTMYIWGPTAKGVLFNMFQTTVSITLRCAENILSKTGLHDRIKRRWRSLLQKNTAEPEG